MKVVPEHARSAYLIENSSGWISLKKTFGRETSDCFAYGDAGASAKAI